MAKPHTKKTHPKLTLDTLKQAMPSITAAFGEMLVEAGAICLENQKHLSGVELSVTGKWPERFELHWSPTTEQMRLCWKDLQDATEFGACGISFLLVRALTKYTVIERSCKGTGFDYWLGDEGDELFQKKVRLEVSGILKGNEGLVNARVRSKLEQTNPSDKTKRPALVAVIEFGTPTAKMVQK